MQTDAPGLLALHPCSRPPAAWREEVADRRLLPRRPGILHSRLGASRYGQRMQAEDRPDEPTREQDYRTLPLAVSLDETIASVEPDAAPDPDANRNLDQHRALRDD